MAANSNKKTTKNTQPRILNKRATYDYAIEERYEAGLVLHGWEVKSVRAGRAQINLAHIYIRDGELFLCNAHMNPADQACTHETLETKREYEKRDDESKKEWKREQERIMKKDARGRHILNG